MIFQRKNKMICLAIAAAFAGSVGVANAALNNDGATYTAPKVASETPITGITFTTAGGNFNAGGAMTSFAPTAGQSLMVNVTLNNGAKFTGAPALNCSSVTGGVSGSTAVLNLGGANSNNAVFTLGSGTYANTSMLAASGCYITPNGISVTGAHNAVNMSITYTYGTLASSTVNGTYIDFASGLKVTAELGNNAVAQVGSGFVTLTGAATSLSAGNIAWMSKNSAVMNGGDGTTAITLVDVMGVGSGSITVAGASLAATKVTGGVWLQTVASGVCASGIGILSTAVAGGVTPITFSGLDASAMSGGMNVCMKFDGTTAIPAGSITAQVGGTALSGYSLSAPAATTLIEITRNGTTLVAPLVNVPAGWISRLVLTNRGPAATYTVSAVSETGTTVTLTGAASSGTIAASSTTVVDLDTLMTTVGNARGSLQVTIAGTSSNIDGLYQLVNAATGNLSNYTLISK